MNLHELKNMLQVLYFAVEHGLIKGMDDSKVAVMLEAKLKQAIEEAESGDDVPSSSE